jgi:hypothetical protein
MCDDVLAQTLKSHNFRPFSPLGPKFVLLDPSRERIFFQMLQISFLSLGAEFMLLGKNLEAEFKLLGRIFAFGEKPWGKVFAFGEKPWGIVFAVGKENVQNIKVNSRTSSV